jgi:tetratricopeptide (TPR) repeat protein
MEDALSLQNFEDLLDPDLLDNSRLFLENGNFSNISNKDGLRWTSLCNDNDTPYKQESILNAKQHILKAHCNCAEYDVENWETDPCKHLMGLYFAIQGKPSISKPAKTAVKKSLKDKIKPVKEPKKPKDPAERLLGELDAKEIFEFVKQTIAKSKDFRSQFLIHFAEKDSSNEQKFGEIIVNAVNAIKGRKKYMQASDAGRLAVTLTPLYKQAVNAESRGLFREAFNISRALLQELPNVYIILENQSVKLSSLGQNNLDLMKQIIQNPELPFEFKAEILEGIKNAFAKIHITNNGSIDMSDYFNLWLLSAKPLNGYQDVIVGLKAMMLPQEEKNLNPWGITYQSNIWVLSRIVNIHKEHIKDNVKFVSFLEEYKMYLPAYIQLIETYTEMGENSKAIAYIEEIKRNSRKYAAYGDVQGMLNKINSILITLLEKTGKTKMAIGIAANLFADSRYQNFEFYEQEKKLTDPKDWENSIKNYVDKLSKMRFNGWSEKDPVIEILGREKMVDRLEGYLSKEKDIYVWIKQGQYLLDLKPTSFFNFTKNLVQGVLQFNMTHEYQKITGLLRMLINHKETKEMCLDYIEELQRKYPNRDALLRILRSL